MRHGVRVDRLARAGGRFVVAAGDRRWEADQVVVASGAYQRPRVPAFAAELDPGIVQLDTSRYRNPSQLRARRGAGGGGRQLRGRDRPRGLPRPPDLAVGPRHRPHPGARRRPLGPAAHPAVLVVRLARADRRHPRRSQGPAQGPGHPGAAGAGAAQGAGRRRGRAGAADGRGARRPPGAGGRSRHGGGQRASGAPGRGPTSAGSTCRSSTRTASRGTTAAWSRPSPACTSSACGS